LARPLESLPERQSQANRGGLRGYEAIAGEYYDALRHPTCANFREGSRGILSAWLLPIPLEGLTLCEIGAGKSVLAELIGPRLDRLDRLFLIDESSSMLDYSAGWEKQGAHLIVGDASSIPMDAGSVDLAVSSLGDPYNGPAFWAEVRRILRSGGRVFFTTPSYEWARSFRSAQASDLNVAEFELSSGEIVSVPSFVLPVSEQIRLMRDHGLDLDRVMDVPTSALGSAPVSPKLLVGRGREASMVTGYALRPMPDGSRSKPIVGLVGHIGSGKTSAGSDLEARGYRRIALSDLLLEEATRRGLGHDRAQLQELGNQLRLELGESILVDRALVRYLGADPGAGMVIDGLRNPGEALAARAAGGIVIGIVRPPGHGSSDEATQMALLRESDPDEPRWGQRVAEALRMADVIVDNKGSIEDLQAGVVRAISRISGLDPEENPRGRRNQ
jgi:SAM-dependent methyltransferase